MKKTTKTQKPERPKEWAVSRERRCFSLNSVEVTAEIESHLHIGCGHVSEWSYHVSRRGGALTESTNRFGHREHEYQYDGTFVHGYVAGGPAAARKLAEKHAFAALQGKPKPSKPRETTYKMCKICEKKSGRL